MSIYLIPIDIQFTLNVTTKAGFELNIEMALKKNEILEEVVESFMEFYNLPEFSKQQYLNKIKFILNSEISKRFELECQSIFIYHVLDLIFNNINLNSSNDIRQVIQISLI